MGNLAAEHSLVLLGELLEALERGGVLCDERALLELVREVLEAVRESLASAALVAQRLPDSYATAVHDVTGAAFVTGMTWALLLGAIIVVVGGLAAWWLFPARLERVEE